MPRAKLVGLLVGGLLLASCQRSSGNPSPPGGGGTVDPPPTATLSVVDSAGAQGPFALDGLDQLVIDVECAHLKPGAHAVRVAVTSPSGSLYAQLPATLQVGESRRGRVSSTLQVRGSTIESYRQLGTWQLVASVDGAQLAAASVDLAP